MVICGSGATVVSAGVFILLVTGAGAEGISKLFFLAGLSPPLCITTPA